MPDRDAQNELNDAALDQAKRAAEARPGLAERMVDVIERLITRANGK